MSARPILTGIASAVLVFSVLPAWASEDLFFASLPVVASVARLQQPLSETPGSMTVIDRELIRQSGARSVAELMRLVPGFFVTPANQDAPRVAYHGLSDESYSPRVQVLIDGVSQYSPLFHGGVNWNLLPVALEDIERIEVMRGSNSTAYGNNAFMGVIHIITSDPALTRGWMFKAAAGYKGVADTTLRWSGKAGEADLRLTVQQSADDGLRHMYTGSDGWFDPHDARKTRLVDLRGTLPLSAVDELRFAISQAYDISQQGRPNDDTDLFRDAAKSSTSLSLGWRRSLADGAEWRVNFAHVEDWASDSYPVLFGGMLFNIADSGVGSRTELEVQHNFSPSEKTRAVWGAGLKNERVRSARQFFDNTWHSRFSARLFGNLEWRPLTWLLINAGANLENSAVGGTLFDPRLGVSWHVTPEQTLRLVASRNHRTPGFFEKGGDSRYAPVAMPQIYDRIYTAYWGGVDTERLDTAEIGYLWDLKEQRASLDLRAFHEHMPNKLQYARFKLARDNRDIFQANDEYKLRYGWTESYFNADNVRVLGYEYQLKWQPFDGTRLLYNHSYIRIASRIEANPDLVLPALEAQYLEAYSRASAPRHSGTLMWMQQLPWGLESSVSYYKSSYMKWTRNTYIDPIERLDWRLALPFKAGAARGEISYTVQAANRTNAEFRNTRLFGQRNWLALRLDL